MSATMATQGGWVQLEQSNRHLAMNMAKMAKGGFLHATIEETQQLIKKHCAKVRAELNCGVGYPGHEQGKAGIERHPAMVQENQMDGFHPCQNGTANNSKTRWTHKRTDAPLPELAAPPPGMPPAPLGVTEGAARSEIEGVPPGYLYIHTPLPNSQCFYRDAYAKDRKRNKDSIPDLLTDEGTSTGWYIMRWVEMQLTSILQVTAAYWANLTVETNIDWKECDFSVLILSTISGHFQVYFKGYIYTDH